MSTDPAFHQSLSAIRRAEALASELDSWLIGSVEKFFDHSQNPKRNEQLFNMLHRARVDSAVDYVEHAQHGARLCDRDDPAIQALPQVVFFGDPDTVHVVGDLESTKSFMYLWGLRWTTGRCDIRDAPDCANAEGFVPQARSEIGPTWYVVVSSHPPVLVAVEICSSCVARLKEVAEGRTIIGELDASIEADPIGAAFAARLRAIREAQDGGEQ